jgi:hypothetical protein
MNGYFGFRLPWMHNQVSCRASCPLDFGYYRDVRGRGYQLAFGSAIRASCSRLGPSGLNGLGWIILSLIFGPGWVDPMGLTTEKTDIFPNNFNSTNIDISFSFGKKDVRRVFIDHIRALFQKILGRNYPTRQQV